MESAVICSPVLCYAATVISLRIPSTHLTFSKLPFCRFPSQLAAATAASRSPRREAAWQRIPMDVTSHHIFIHSVVSQQLVLLLVSAYLDLQGAESKRVGSEKK